MLLPAYGHGEIFLLIIKGSIEGTIVKISEGA
jgi:hypothetical protein